MIKFMMGHMRQKQAGKHKYNGCKVNQVSLSTDKLSNIVLHIVDISAVKVQINIRHINM